MARSPFELSWADKKLLIHSLSIIHVGISILRPGQGSSSFASVKDPGGTGGERRQFTPGFEIMFPRA